MKALLRFDLPEDAQQHRDALDGWKWRAVAFDTDEWLRGKLKYGHEFPDATAALEAARASLRAEIDASGLSLDDMA